MLDVLTLNLWGDNGPAGERMATLCAYLEADPPDVVALQEVAAVDGRNQAELVAEAAGHDTVAFERAGRLGLGEGLALTTRLDARATAVVTLPRVPRDHARALQLVDVITADGRAVRVGNTHLAWRLDAGEGRSAQTEAIRDALSGWTGPVVLCGDLNDVPGSAALAVLAAAPLELRDTYAEAGGDERPTFDRDNPYLWQPELAGRRVDHVLVRGLATVRAAIVLDGRDGEIVSDHYGVRTVVKRR